MSRAEKMYGKGAKIRPADGPASEESEAVSEVKKTAGDPHKEQASAPEKTEVPDGGGQMLAMHEVHGREMKEMHGRHEKERRDMHTRHEGEHSSMMKRHMKEMGDGGDKKMPENVGDKSGTEPK